MKRGLKGYFAKSTPILYLCCTNYPDEKGTESGSVDGIPRSGLGRCTNYPDEKGTESMVGNQ